MSHESGRGEVLSYQSPSIHRRRRFPFSIVAAWLLRLVLLGVAWHLFDLAMQFSREERHASVLANPGTDQTIVVSPNTVTGPATQGFAIAGGLALLAAALVRVDSRGR